MIHLSNPVCIYVATTRLISADQAFNIVASKMPLSREDSKTQRKAQTSRVCETGVSGLLLVAALSVVRRQCRGAGITIVYFRSGSLTADGGTFGSVVSHRLLREVTGEPS